MCYSKLGALGCCCTITVHIPVKLTSAEDPWVLVPEIVLLNSLSFPAALSQLPVQLMDGSLSSMSVSDIQGIGPKVRLRTSEVKNAPSIVSSRVFKGFLLLSIMMPSLGGAELWLLMPKIKNASSYSTSGDNQQTQILAQALPSSRTINNIITGSDHLF